jgi:drug/metabolite transporter (DMT)-like permease
MNSRIAGSLEILLAALIFGSFGIFVRAIGTDITPFSQVMIRMSFATLVMLSFIVVTKKKIVFKWNDWYIFVIGGILGIGLMTVFFILGVLNTQIANVSLLLYTEPVFAFLFGFLFLKERITKKMLLCITLSMLGIFCIFFNSKNFALTTGGILGNVFALISAIFYACFPIAARMASKKNYDKFLITFLSFLFASIALMPVAFFLEKPLSLSAPTRTWFILFLYATLDLVSYVLISDGFKKLPASVGSLYLIFEPISAIIYGYVLFGETLSAYTFLGALLIFTSITIISRSELSEVT